MKSVWKYELEPSAQQVLTMPTGARVVHVRGEGRSIYLWAEVDSEAPATTRPFAIVGTGHEVPPEHVHLGTAFFATLELVFHVYEPEGATDD